MKNTKDLFGQPKMPYFIYTFICQWTLGFLLLLGYYEYSAMNMVSKEIHGRISLRSYFQFF